MREGGNHVLAVFRRKPGLERFKDFQHVPAIGQTVLTSFLSLSAYLSDREEHLSNSFQIKFRFN